jgi:hypothetical protein
MRKGDGPSTERRWADSRFSFGAELSVRHLNRAKRKGMLENKLVGSLVRITKLRVTPNALFAPSTRGEYVPGGDNPGVSLPVDYVNEGILLRPPELGERVLVLRLVRDGDRAPGAFQSGPIVEMSTDEFTTLNSVYRIELLAQRPPWA